MPRATRTQVLAARRIAVLGVTGAGKSTAARALAEALRLLAAPDGVPVLRLTEPRQLDSLLGLLRAAR